MNNCRTKGNAAIAQPSISRLHGGQSKTCQLAFHSSGRTSHHEVSQKQLALYKVVNLLHDNVAIWTMVRNENFFLRLWVEYYSKFVPRRNLFILVDGADSEVPDNLEGCTLIVLPQDDPSPGWDQRRWEFLSSFASSLTLRYDVVIGGDVDEVITVDPEVGQDPIQFILEDTTADVIAPFAIDLIHRIDLEDDFDPSRGVLEQRSFGRINTLYSKPCIIRKPVTWSLGQHFSSNPGRELSDKLFLFHLKYLDHGMLIERQRERLQQISNANSQMVNGVAGRGWYRTLDQISNELKVFVDAGPPRDVDMSFRHIHKKLRETWAFDKDEGLWRHATIRRSWTFPIPDRFKTLF
ncbi:hypothetical protein [Ruegeria atlantica]|uniref:hypothetical protein n=1 Tax=Ruegeria atlantica TaxID=81569 RepID=UPI001481997B|nr:hypothetical protein [Ruegeria atlantica]